MCRSQAEAESALKLLHEQMALRKLTLHPEKTKIADATARGGFDFLGYHFERGMRWPRKKSLTAFKDRVRSLTPRNSGKSTAEIINKLNPMIRGWFEYFKHCIRSVPDALDGWIRRRLRNIFCKRLHMRSRGLGTAHQRWTNAYFRELGLFTMLDARARLLQSLRG